MFKVEVNTPSAPERNISVNSSLVGQYVDIEADGNVAGTVEGVDETWIDGVRRWLVGWLPKTIQREEMRNNKGSCCFSSPLKPMRGIVDWIEPDHNPMEAGVVVSVVNGDIEAEGVGLEDQVTKSGGRDAIGYVRVHNGRRARHNRKALRIPVLAGEVASGLKMRHGILKRSEENVKLVRSDAARRIEALRRDGDPMFKNLRNHDMYTVVMHAAEMYWIASDDERDVAELYNNPHLKDRRRCRQGMATPHLE
jgi:hypothetical protein